MNGFKVAGIKYTLLSRHIFPTCRNTLTKNRCIRMDFCLQNLIAFTCNVSNKFGIEKSIRLILRAQILKQS